jgi:phosphohistidine phosphatase
MKILYIMRHAKSSWKDASLDDHRRPLKKRGKRDSKEMGRRLAARAIAPDYIMSSDARRAMDTATAIVAALGIPADRIHRQPALYHVTASELQQLIHDLPDRYARVMLFGHNPTLTDFVNAFLDPPIPNLPTCGIVELHFACEAWREIDTGCVSRRHVDFPKNR